MTTGDYLVTSLGTTHFAQWGCLNCVECRRHRPGQGFEEFRNTAAAHVRVTGHTVEIVRGSEELLTGVNTVLPERKAITA